MTDAMSKLLAGLHIEQTETQRCNNEAGLYNERGQWIAEFAYADAAEVMVAAVNEHDTARAVLKQVYDALVAGILSPKHRKVLFDGIASGHVDRVASRIGWDTFDPTGRVRAIMAAQKLFAQIEEATK